MESRDWAVSLLAVTYKMGRPALLQGQTERVKKHPIDPDFVSSDDAT